MSEQEMNERAPFLERWAVWALSSQDAVPVIEADLRRGPADGALLYAIGVSPIRRRQIQDALATSRWLLLTVDPVCSVNDLWQLQQMAEQPLLFVCRPGAGAQLMYAGFDQGSPAHPTGTLRVIADHFNVRSMNTLKSPNALIDTSWDD